MFPRHGDSKARPETTGMGRSSTGGGVSGVTTSGAPGGAISSSEAPVSWVKKNQTWSWDELRWVEILKLKVCSRCLSDILSDIYKLHSLSIKLSNRPSIPRIHAQGSHLWHLEAQVPPFLEFLEAPKHPHSMAPAGIAVIRNLLKMFGKHQHLVVHQFSQELI